jgi:putative transposase
MMILQRAFKLRLYPTPTQDAELREWERQLRWLYNLAHEQRLMALARPRGEQPRVDYYRQSREMTELLTVDPQLGRVVCSARQEVLRDLEKAWQRFWKRLGGRPRFKRRIDTVRVYLSTPKHWRLEGGVLHLAGMASSVGPIKMFAGAPSDRRAERQWRKLDGCKLSSCAMVRDVGEWFAVFPVEYSAEIQPAPAKAVGINRGAIHAIADSEGRVVDSPHFYEKGLLRVQRRSRDLARTKPGSKNRLKAAERLAKAHQVIRRQREWWLHDQSAHYAKNYGTIAVEDMGTKKMLESPRTEEKFHFSTTCKRTDCGEPVYKRRVCRKHYEEQRFIPKGKVRRSILDVGWYELGRQLEYKSSAAGGRVLKVDPAHVSRIDSESGVVRTDPASGHATWTTESGAILLGDVNAARNVLGRALAMPAPARKTPKASIKIKGRVKAQPASTAKPAVQACGGDPLVEGPGETGTLPREG